MREGNVMPAVSKRQRGYFGLVLAAKEGKKKPPKISAKKWKEAKRTANTMSASQIKDYTGTSPKGLPYRKKAKKRR